jgi:hypothetical protein
MADRPPKLGLPCPDETLLGPLDGRPAANAWPQPCTVESGCTDSVDVSGVLSLGIRLVVWDFDLTLLSIHSFALRLTAADVAVRNLQSDFYALDFYVSLVRRLVDAGVGVAIASFGRGEVIRAYMDRVFIVGADSVQNIFVGSNICTPATIGGVDGWAQPRGKNALLEHLISDPFRGLQKTEVIFFDGKLTYVITALVISSCQRNCDHNSLALSLLYSQTTLQTSTSRKKLAFRGQCTHPKDLMVRSGNPLLESYRVVVQPACL